MALSREEEILNALINGEKLEFKPLSRFEEYMKCAINKSGTENCPTPISRSDALLKILADKMCEGSNLQEKTVNPKTTAQTITPDSGYDGFSKVNVNAIQTEEKAVTPTTEAHEITPTNGKYISKVVVSAVTSAIDSNIVAENIKKGITILDVTGTLETGGDQPKLYAPSITISDNVLYITNASENGAFVERYYLYVDGYEWTVATDDQLAGDYEFYNTFSFIPDTTLNVCFYVDFTCNNVEYNILGFKFDGSNGKISIVYTGSGEDDVPLTVCDNGVWIDDIYRTITITSKYSEVLFANIDGQEITDTDDSHMVVEQFMAILFELARDKPIYTTSDSIDLQPLFYYDNEGDYSISVKCSASKFEDSDFSNVVSWTYTKSAIGE